MMLARLSGSVARRTKSSEISGKLLRMVILVRLLVRLCYDRLYTLVCRSHPRLPATAQLFKGLLNMSVYERCRVKRDLKSLGLCPCGFDPRRPHQASFAP